MEVAQRIYEYYQKRYTDKGSVILDYTTDKVGTIASIQSNAGNIKGLVVSIDIDLAGGALGEVKTVGVTE